ncbi:MAG: hypothetical protein Q3966_05620 [Neisseria sp.]|nr:hypothetical protein [Neisseria sp.]
MQKTIIIILAALAAAPAYAQSCAQTDAALAKAYTEMVESGSYGSEGSANEDKRAAAEKHFGATLKTYLKQKDSWACTFTLTSGAGVAVYTSGDKRLRGFSWDSQSGGTLHEYQTILQYLDASGKPRIREGGDGFLTGIQADTLGKHGTAYILTEATRASTTLRGQSLSLLHIKNGSLQPLNIIRANGRTTNTLGYEYITSDSDNQDFAYDAPSKTISFPLVPQTKAGSPEADYGAAEVSSRRIRYRFDGAYFSLLKTVRQQ